jgi:hypothetical protein
MLETDEINLAEVQTLRRRILQTIHVTDRVGVDEKTLMTVLNRAGHILLPHELRKHLDYLHDLKSIEIIDKDRATWVVKILPYGRDIIEYAVKPPPGIAKG